MIPLHNPKPALANQRLISGKRSCWVGRRNQREHNALQTEGLAADVCLQPAVGVSHWRTCALQWNSISTKTRLKVKYFIFFLSTLENVSSHFSLRVKLFQYLSVFGQWIKNTGLTLIISTQKEKKCRIFFFSDCTTVWVTFTLIGCDLWGLRQDPAECERARDMQVFKWSPVKYCSTCASPSPLPQYLLPPPPTSPSGLQVNLINYSHIKTKRKLND